MFDPSQEKPNYTELDERTDYFYEAVTAAGGMVSTTPGVGSAYLGAYKDKNNQWFDGSHWIETVPDKAWFAYFRFYGPTEGYFNRTYALPDFEEVTN